MSENPTRRQLGTEQLRVLAHPLRFRILELLREEPANSTVLAHRLGESTGATSYHLRQLARYGLIEEHPGRSVGRERWWRRREDMLLMDVAVADSEHIAAQAELRATILERDDEAIGALAERPDLLAERPDNLWLGSWRINATTDEIRALAAQIVEAVDALRRSPEQTPADAKLTHVTFRTVPLA